MKPSRFDIFEKIWNILANSSRNMKLIQLLRIIEVVVFLRGYSVMPFSCVFFLQNFAVPLNLKILNFAKKIKIIRTQLANRSTHVKY
jgi:hypothetical protein